MERRYRRTEANGPARWDLRPCHGGQRSRSNCRSGGEKTIRIEIGTIPGGGAVIVDYALDVSAPPSGLSRLVNQALVTSDELPPVWSDDPTTSEDADPTVYALSGGPGGPGEPSGPGSGDLPWGGSAEIIGLVPADGGVVTAPVDVTVGVVAPVDDRSITEWFVTTYPAGADPGSAVTLAEGTGDPSESVLGEFDPTVRANGPWNLRLTVVDSTGEESFAESSLVVGGQLKLGRYSVTYEDMSVPVAGMPIQVLRTYDTLDKDTEGDFGFGWNLELANFRVQANRTLGLGPWTGESCGPGLIFVPLCFSPGSSRFVTVTWPDGRTEVFDFTPTGNTFFAVAMVPEYTPRPGATSTLAPAPGDISGSRGGDGHMRAGGFGDGAVYDPQRFVLTAKDGTRYLLDRTSGLVSAKDRNDNTVTVSADGVVSSSGPGISFERDDQGGIERIVGPDGASVTYGYDAVGDLVAVTDANQHTTDYEYDDHYLTEVVDPTGAPWRRMEYDLDTGRVEAIVDANGNRSEISVDQEARTQVVTSPDGLLTTVSSFDERGNEVVRDEVFNGVSHPTTFTYSDDGLDLITSRTDPEGNVWSGEYDGPNLVRFVDAEGHATQIDYDGFGFPTRVVDAAGGETRFGYDAVGNLESILDALDNETTFTYDARGNRIGKVDPEGNTTSWTYTPAGFVQSRTSHEGRVTTWSYDDAGRVLTETLVATGATMTWVYDDVGNLVSRTDPEGNTTSWEYDPSDRVVTETDPELFTTTYGYDPVGKVVSVVDALDHETIYEYDSANRLELRRDPLGHETTWSYDGAGRLVEVVDARGGVTSYGHDLAGRRISITAPNRGTTILTPDGNGRVVAETNGEGETTTFEHDPMGRLTRVLDPTGREMRYGFDLLGRTTSVTNNAGDVIRYRFDDAGRLVEVVDAEEYSTLYGYDGDGNQVSVTDAVGNTTSNVYDDAGRLVEVIDPRGALDHLCL